ncbi:MAG: HPF/RaiA family ribosome-associated protein [Gemmatimonadales bacterium]
MLATTITARHCEIPAELRARADEVCRRLGAQTRRPLEASVTFDLDGLERIAEIRLHNAGGDVFVATGDGKDHRSALDRAEEKLRRQLEKRHSHPGRDRASLGDV